MPLEIIPAALALKNLRTAQSIWPERGRKNRKGLVPLPAVAARFHFEETDKVFCMGSCFAHHVGFVMKASGINVVTQVPNPTMQGDWGGSNHLIRYNVFSILNEFRWALDPATPYLHDYALEEQDGLLMDPFGHTHSQSHTPDAARELRRFTQSITARIRECRILVITMGLAEVWHDAKYNLYTNLQPPRQALTREPDRFTLRVLSYADVLQALNELDGLLRQHGHPDYRILLTTSPVPLHATFRKQDVFTANTYSKSVQRAAAEQFVAENDRVDYFPSYESVTLASPDFAWKSDQRHVTEPTVNAIMEHVMRAYLPHKNIGNQAEQSIRQIENQIASLGAETTLETVFALARLAEHQRTQIKELKARLDAAQPALAAS